MSSRKYQKEWHAKHPTYGTEYARKWRANNPIVAKAKARRNNLRTQYGITVEQYEALFAAHGGVCAVCKLPKPKRHLHIDHCHKTGRIRALLCNNCNTALGLLKENVVRILALADYARKCSETKIEVIEGLGGVEGEAARAEIGKEIEGSSLVIP